MERTFQFAYPVWTIPQTEQLIAEAMFGVTALATLVYCLWVAKKEGKVWPLWVFVGACLTSAWEPFSNMLTNAAYPSGGPHPLPYFFGREIPLSVFFIYIFYIGFPVTWLYKRFGEGVTAKQMLKYMIVGLILIASFEPYYASRGWWKYYGAQPMNWTGQPVYYWFNNVAAVFFVAAVFHLVRKHLLTSDRQTWVFAPLSLMALWASHSTDIPIILALHNTTDSAIIMIAGLLTIALSLLILWMVKKAISTS